jgi:hypothetical protein
MTAKQAKEILLEYQRWRRGLAPYHEASVKIPYHPGERDKAIEFAIQTITTMYGEK